MTQCRRAIVQIAGLALAVLFAAVFVATFFAATFFAAAGCAFAAFSALTFAQRRFVAAMIFLMPSALIRRLGFGGSGEAGDDGSAVPLMAAHRLFCPSAILRRAAAEILRFFGAISGIAAVSTRRPDSIARSSAICWSIRVFCASKPSMAAAMISFVSFAGI